MKPTRTRLSAIAFGALVTSMSAVVLFATPPTPASAATNPLVLTATSPTDSDPYKSVTIACPRGTYVLGGGGNVIGGGHSVRLYMIRPNLPPYPPNSMTIGGREDSGGYALSWYLVGWTICGSGVTGYEIVEVMKATNTGETFGSITAACPAGKKVIGAGGSAHKSQAVLSAIYIDPNLQSVTAAAYLNEAHVGTGITLGVSAWAVCVDPIPGQEVVTAGSASSSEDKVVHVACPSGTEVTSTGGGIIGAYGQAYMDALLPDGWGTGTFITVQEDETGYPGNWIAYAQAICVP